MGGEGAPCLHFVWNEERAEGCVKDAKEGQKCSVFLFCICACGVRVDAHKCVCSHLILKNRTEL